MTIREIAAALGVSQDTVRERLRPLVEQGLIMPVRVVRINLAGQQQRVWGYRTRQGAAGDQDASAAKPRPVDYREE